MGVRARRNTILFRSGTQSFGTGRRHGTKAGAVRGRARAENGKVKKNGFGMGRDKLLTSPFFRPQAGSHQWARKGQPQERNAPGTCLHGWKRVKRRGDGLTRFLLLCQRDRSAGLAVGNLRQPNAGLRSGALLVGVRPPHPPALDGMKDEGPGNASEKGRDCVFEYRMGWMETSICLSSPFGLGVACASSSKHRMDTMRVIALSNKRRK